MFEFFVMAIIVAFVYIMGFKRGYDVREREAIKKLDGLMDAFEAEEKENTIYIKIERVNGVFFVYKEEDSSFMAQGKTKSDISKVLNERFPNKKFSANEENLRQVGFYNE
jgi:hypothetical protein